jgi:hypothetical protein
MLAFIGFAAGDQTHAYTPFVEDGCFNSIR